MNFIQAEFPFFFVFSSARLALVPEYFRLSFPIFARRRRLVCYRDFNFRKQSIVFVSDQARSFVHVLLRTRSALRLKLCPTPLYYCDNSVGIHGIYFSTFADFLNDLAFFSLHRAAAAFLAISLSRSGERLFARALPPFPFPLI